MSLTNSDETVATNKPKINVYVGNEINQAIEKEMARGRRSRSQMVELLLEEALKAKGDRLVTSIMVRS